MVRPTRRADVVSVHTSLEAFYNELQQHVYSRCKKPAITSAIFHDCVAFLLFVIINIIITPAVAVINQSLELKSHRLHIGVTDLTLS